jgi:uncharacterized repeat protein (TIGR01451 family)
VYLLTKALFCAVEFIKGGASMKAKDLLVSLVLGLGLVLGLLWALNGCPALVVAAPAAELHVCPSGCTHSSVQDAVDAAGDGDVIKVAAGTYTGVSVRPRSDITATGVVTQVVYISKTVTIRGGYTTGDWTTSNPEANPTTLDAQGQGRVFYVTGDIAPTIGGLRITGGDATGLGGWPDPFGATEDEDSDAGGGIYVITASATIEDNYVFSNVSARVGGGIALNKSDATLSDNTVTLNASGSGAGLFLQGSHGMISRNTISNNTADGAGGLELFASSPTLEGNTVTTNTATVYGCGGVRLFLSSATLRANAITANIAEREGGGLCMMACDDAALLSNVIADNQAGTVGSGMHIEWSSLRLLHNTIAHNSGGDGSGIYIREYDVGDTSWVTLINTILASQSVGIAVTGGNTATVNGILWYNTPTTISQSPTATVSVQNQLTGDPAFVDPDGGDYHIGANSPARDVGVDSGVRVDMDGQWRPMGLGYDLGADEYAGAGLDVAKQASLELVNRGETLTYTIIVTSTGTDNATGVVVTDTLDNWQRIVGVSPSVGGCTIPGTGWGGSAVCTLGTLVPGTTALVTVTVEVSTAATPEQVVVNTAIVKANEIPSSSAQATAYIQDCYARINAGATEYGTVQAAVDAASPGDVIKVAGTCIGVNTHAGLPQQVYVDKSITVRGGYTTTNWTTSDPELNPTTLDALGEGRVLYITGDISPTIEGLRITGGDASGLGGVPWGWDAGGGVYVVSATATISNNQICNNHSGNLGGGLFLWRSKPTLNGNAITSNNTDGYGGGVLFFESIVTFNSNSIAANTSTLAGGGIAAWGHGVTLNNDTIIDNVTGGDGGGLAGGVAITMVNTIVADNQANRGGGIYVDGSTRLLHNTIVGNTSNDGSGIYVAMGGPAEDPSGNTVALTNTILAQHSVGISVTGSNTVTVNGILWHNVYDNVSQSPTATVSLQNQYWGNPAFVYPDGGDYHIDADSAAIDRGVDAVISTDIDGESRPIGASYDLGADEYPCDGVSNAQLSRTPSGDLFTGNTVLFMAEADGSTPFTYTWTLNGGAAGGNRGTFEHIFSVSGIYTIGVTVANVCGSDAAAMVVEVNDPAPQQPDLSQSYKSVNLISVEGGDILTYTLVVRNRSAVSATAILTDAIPDHTTYIPGSVQASSSSTLMVQNGQVRWSGQVITGTPVIVQFAVEVTMTGLTVGDVITNVAALDDGLGNVMTLDTQSTYNPGYGLSIDDGALYTDIPTVTLRYSWNVVDDIVYVKFSNDGGFGAGSSGWMPVDAIDPTYDDWVLETYGDLRLPRTVYIKFRNGSGVQYGPFQDDIIYDPVEPQVTEVEIITQTAGGYVKSVTGQDVIVRVTSSDDNSGASIVQISHSVDFVQYSEFAVTGPTTDIPWVLQSSGEVYVRVVDRAGNVSEVESEQGPPKYGVYLPLMIRD